MPRVQVPGGARRTGVLAVMLMTLCSPYVAGHCISHVNVTGGPLVTSATDILSVTLLVREAEAVGRLLYRVTWDEDVTPTIPDQGDFVNYFHVDDSGAREWRVTVRDSLIGLPDHPRSKAHVTVLVVFPAFSDGDVCSLLLSHLLKDDNTQKPAVEASTWVLHIPKDFPTYTPLQGITVTVTDDDATEPNNLMEVGVEGLCPLAVGEKQYGGVAGDSYVVPLHLTSPLNDMVNETFTCTLRVTDMGTSPLSSIANLTLSVVEDVPNTTTATTTTAATTTSTTFTLGLPFYLAEVWPGMEVGLYLTTFPELVKVKESDPALSQVTYALRDAWPGVNGTEYFAINSSTGQVLLARDLQDGSWAAGGGGIFVPLVIQAQDSSGTVSTAILHIVMRSEGAPTYHLQPSVKPTPPCRPASSSPCSCPAIPSQDRPRLSFTMLSYASEVFSTDSLVGRVEARLGGRQGFVRYSWASPTNVTGFVLNSVTGDITIGPSGVTPGRHLLTALATAGRLSATAQVRVRVLEEKEEEGGGDGNGLRRVRTVNTSRKCEPSELVGLQVAVGVLASLLGLVLLAAGVCGVLLYRRRKAREARARTEVKHISTLGSAYPNLSFSRESPE